MAASMAGLNPAIRAAMTSWEAAAPELPCPCATTELRANGSMDHIVIDGITKSFGEFKALDNVSITVAKGAIHAILGENGAGKTTLMNILYGLYRPDEGQILLDGKALRMTSPRDAIAQGIGMIHQHFMLVNSLTVTENIVLGLDRGLEQIDFKTHEKRIRELSQRIGFDIDPQAEVWTSAHGHAPARRDPEGALPQGRSSHP